MAVVVSPFDNVFTTDEATAVPNYGLDPLYSPSSGPFAGNTSPITNAFARNMHGSLAQARLDIKRASRDDDAYRKQLEVDLNEMSSFINHDHDKSVASDRVLHHLADALHAEIDNENDLAADLTSAVVKDESAIKQIIEDVKVVNAAEKADLVLEQISSYATIARDTANLAADAAEIIPFGASAAGVIRTGADIADVVAQTTTTIQRSGITKSLGNVITNLHTGELSPAELLTQSMTVAKDVEGLVNEMKTIPMRRERRIDLTFASASDPTSVMHDTEYYSVYGIEGAPMYYVVRDSRSPYYTKIKVDGYGLTYEVIRRSDGVVRLSNGTVSLSGTKKKIANRSEMHSVMAICKLFGGFTGISYNVNTVRSVIETLITLGTVTREALTVDTYNNYVSYKSEFDHDDAERVDHSNLVQQLSDNREAWKTDNPLRVPLLTRDSRVKFTDQLRSSKLNLLFVEGNDYSVYGCSYGPISKSGTLRVAYMVSGCTGASKAIVQMATQSKNFVSTVQDDSMGQRSFTISKVGGLHIAEGDMLFVRVYAKSDMTPRVYMKLVDTDDGFDVPVTNDNHNASVEFKRDYKNRFIEVPVNITNATLSTGAIAWSDYEPPNWTFVPA
uniref:VP4 n=1 Tax=viral metagenome TaxID=1070528 RepID=A0A2V0R9J7_9ZZZZ